MNNTKVAVTVSWVLAVWISFVFLQSLVFKFSGHDETEIIFSTIGEWMSSTGILSALAAPFSAVGGYAIGISELIAVILILIPKTRLYGAGLGLMVMSGAIFFHLFTPLGIDRVIDDQGNTDNGALFYMACSVWVCCIILIGMTLNQAGSQQQPS